MKQCPKCQANISDTAKFCVKCGCNIKKYEEEQAQVYFCPECGTKFSGGVFCPECGCDVRNELNGQPAPAETTDPFGDDWLSDLESSSNMDVATMQAQKSKEQMEKALSSFEYESHSDGTYTIVALKDKHALNITVPVGVVAIADRAFEGCEAFNISLPEGLLKIGNAAFKNSADLSSINLPQSLITIGDEAFAECEMLDIQIPDSVRKVGKDAILNTVQDKKRKAALAKYQVGNIVTFGSYKKAIRYASGKVDYEDNITPIEWIVLQQEGEKALLISNRILDFKPFNNRRVDVTWETCTLRSWLNDEFLNNAFNRDEREKIMNTNVVAERWDYGCDPGNNTIDKIFLLSYSEVKIYFGGEELYGTDWWLRTPYLKDCFLVGTNNAMSLRVKGNTDDPAHYYVDTRNIAVRPAMWIKI